MLIHCFLLCTYLLLFNFQRPYRFRLPVPLKFPSPWQLQYYIISGSICQEVFQTFLSFFRSRFLAPRRLSDSLNIISHTIRFVKRFFKLFLCFPSSFDSSYPVSSTACLFYHISSLLSTPFFIFFSSFLKFHLFPSKNVHSSIVYRFSNRNISEPNTSVLYITITASIWFSRAYSATAGAPLSRRSTICSSDTAHDRKAPKGSANESFTSSIRRPSYSLWLYITRLP